MGIEALANLLATSIPPDLLSFSRTREDQQIFHSSTPVPVGVSVAVQNVEQVQAVFGAARVVGAKVSVLTSGHGIVAGLAHDVALNMAAFDRVSVDPTERVATVGGGVAWSRVMQQCASHGLAPLNGSSPDVGAAGYTSGGGIGLLSREYGFCADHVIDVDVVTGAGEMVTASPAEAADLFWAVRGGKSSVGVISQMRVPLFEIDQFFGGNLCWPAERAVELIPAIFEWARDLADTTSMSVALINFPPLPEIPAQLRGRAMIVLRLCTTDPPSDRSRIDSLASATRPEINSLREMQLMETGTIHADPTQPGDYRSWSHGLSQLGSASLSAIEEWVSGSYPAVAVMEFRLMGGALSRIPEVPNCVDGRDFPINFFATGVAGVPPGTNVNEDLLRVADDLAGDLAEKLLVNFIGAQQRDEVWRAYSAGTLSALERVVADVDPDRVMRTVFDQWPGRSPVAT